MTAQIMDIITYLEEKVPLASEPLTPYLKLHPELEFIAPHTACHRGYVAHWEIKNKQLYLTDFKGFLQYRVTVGLNFLFEDQDEVFADWFSGTIYIPQGELLYYVHGGYDSIYEKDLVLTIKNGKVVEEKIIDNYDLYKKRKAEDDDLPF